MKSDTETGAVVQKVQWRRAIRAMVGLAGDTARTDHVFEIITALTGGSFERTYQAFVQSSTGRTLLEERPSLMTLLDDRERLLGMPEGSLGREYLAFMDQYELSADGLVSAQDTARESGGSLQFDPDRQYVADRLRDMHDLWHVLSGYGMDDTGEIANLWFSVGQFGNPGMAFIAFLGTIGGTWSDRLAWQRYCYRAFLRGKQAVPLVSAPIETMLELPIDEARARLGIEPPSKAHPRGMRRGYRAAGQLGAMAPVAA
jgi:ubiquinone biosynthesis protein COQ4